MASTNASEVTGPMPGWVIKRTASSAFGFFQNRAVQLCDRRIELIEQLQKFFAPAAGPGCQCQTCELPAAFFGEQLFLAPQALAHREEGELITQHRAQAHQLVAMPNQLSEIPVGDRGN